LYNKECALEFLIDRSKFECAPSFEYLRGLKDLKQLNLTGNRSYARPKSDKGDGYCGKPFQEGDVIVLNGTEEEVDQLRSRMEERRLQQKLEKKAKKAKKHKAETATSDSAAECGPSTSKQARLEQPVNGDTKLTNGSKVSKVVANDNKKLTNGSKGSKTLANGTTVRNPLLATADLPTTSSSIQKDPKSSAAYKNLFTSCDRAKRQMKGHWVTSNPYWM
ncbi:RTF2-like protein, partial [Mya arenaria]